MDQAELETLHHGASQSPFPSAATVEEVRRIIELIRPAIQADGGDLEFVSLTTSGVVHVRLHGACIGCPSSSVTLQGGVAKVLRERVPGITGVEAIEA